MATANATPGFNSNCELAPAKPLAPPPVKRHLNKYYVHHLGVKITVNQIGLRSKESNPKI